MKSLKCLVVTAVLALAVAPSFAFGQTAYGAGTQGEIFTEDFSGGVPGPYGLGNIAGTEVSVTGGNVDIIGVLNGWYYVCDNNPLGNCLDLIGYLGCGAIRSIHAFNLVAGHTYTVSFGVIVRGVEADLQFSVGLGHASQIETATPVAQEMVLTYTPDVDQADASLTFASITNVDNVHGPVLDHISVTESIGVDPVFSENFDELTPQLHVTSAGPFHAIDGTNVDIVGDGVYGELCKPPTSGYCIDLDGTDGHSQGVLQSINGIMLQPGTNYYLSFDLIGSQRGNTTSATVDFGPYHHTFVLTSNDDSSGIVTNALVTVSTETMAFLTFTSNTPGNMGTILDNVSISEQTQ